MSEQQVPGTFPVPQLGCSPWEIENSLGDFISYWTQYHKLLPRLSLPALSFLDAAIFKLCEIPCLFSCLLEQSWIWTLLHKGMVGTDRCALNFHSHQYSEMPILLWVRWNLRNVRPFLPLHSCFCPPGNGMSAPCRLLSSSHSAAASPAP